MYAVINLCRALVDERVVAVRRALMPRSGTRMSSELIRIRVARAMQRGVPRGIPQEGKTMIRTACAITTMLGGALVGIPYGCTMMSSNPQQTRALSADGGTGSDAG